MVDRMLLGFAEHARDRGGEWPVTFMVGGQLVAGVLVSEERWHAQMADTFANAPDPSPELDQLARQFRDWRTMAVVDGLEQQEITHLHLVRAQVGGSPKQGQWRVRVDAVDGWRFGALVLPVGDGPPVAPAARSAS